MNIDDLAFLIIFLAWILRMVLGPLMKKKTGREPASPTDLFGDDPPRQKAERPVRPQPRQTQPEPQPAPQTSRRQATRPVEARAAPPAPTTASLEEERQRRYEEARRKREQMLRDIGLDPTPPPPPAPARPVRPAPPPTIPEAEAIGQSVLAGARSLAEIAGHEMREEDRITLEPFDREEIGAAPIASSEASSSQATGLAARVLADLRGGRSSLARAVVLADVLGPPVSLRPPGEIGGGLA